MKRIKIRARGRADGMKKPFAILKFYYQRIKREKVEAKSGTES